MIYLWETHLHTAEVSRCGTVPAEGMVAAYKRAGYHGLVVTDHFFNGHSWGNGSQPWQKKVDILIGGYQAARQAGDALGVAVLLGWEYAHEGADYLTYGLDEQFLRDQSDLCDIPLEVYIARVREAGGLVAQAHPFREAWYMPPGVQKRWDLVEAIEVFNGSHKLENRHWDDKALALARKHGCIEMAGSDAHDLTGVATAAMAFDEPFFDKEDFLSALRGRKGRVMRGQT